MAIPRISCLRSPALLSVFCEVSDSGSSERSREESAQTEKDEKDQKNQKSEKQANAEKDEDAAKDIEEDSIQKAHHMIDKVEEEVRMLFDLINSNRLEERQTFFVHGGVICMLTLFVSQTVMERLNGIRTETYQSLIRRK